MFSRESRPLKRPRLGVPDFYPQETKQREVWKNHVHELIPGFALYPRWNAVACVQDELSYQTLNIGFRVTLPSMVDSQSEVSLNISCAAGLLSCEIFFFFSLALLSRISTSTFSTAKRQEAKNILLYRCYEYTKNGAFNKKGLVSIPHLKIL